MKNLNKAFSKALDIPYESAAEYERKQEFLIKEVNENLSKRSDIKKLIGNNPLSVMEENHNNHADFMSTVFKLNQHELFLQTVPWVYRTYHARDFSYEYFPVAFQAWIDAINKHIEPHLARPLIQAYNCMADYHEHLIELSRSTSQYSFEAEKSWKNILDSFLAALLKGNHKTCLQIANKSVQTREDLENFYIQVLQTAMYQIGDMWEKGKISVAHEHLSSAIVSRVMANLYPSFILAENTKHKAVITACANEFHELGARMVADFLEIDGWDVNYLGANVPEAELIELLKDSQPLLLGISVAMPFNIDKTITMIKNIKSINEFKNLKIMVGGKIFSENPHLWETTEADGWASNGRDAVLTASRWWQVEKNAY